VKVSLPILSAETSDCEFVILVLEKNYLRISVRVLSTLMVKRQIAKQAKSRMP
jgi:hypothetical protein